jgi:hypothetical protein
VHLHSLYYTDFTNHHRLLIDKATDKHLKRTSTHATPHVNLHNSQPLEKNKGKGTIICFTWLCCRNLGSLILYKYIMIMGWALLFFLLGLVIFLLIFRLLLSFFRVFLLFFSVRKTFALEVFNLVVYEIVKCNDSSNQT